MKFQFDILSDFWEIGNSSKVHTSWNCIKSACDVNVNFLIELGEFMLRCSKRIDYSFGKVHFTSEILD